MRYYVAHSPIQLIWHQKEHRCSIHKFMLRLHYKNNAVSFRTAHYVPLFVKLNCCRYRWPSGSPWWHHQMETFSALLTLCAGYSQVTGEFSSQRPVTRSVDFFFVICALNKQSWGWWFGTPWRSLWRHCYNKSAKYILSESHGLGLLTWSCLRRVVYEQDR